MRRPESARPPLVLAGLLLALALGPTVGPDARLAAQNSAAGPPRPALHAAWHSEAAGDPSRLIVTVTPPPGWELYAPRVAVPPVPTTPSSGGEEPGGADGAPAPLLGRPLEVGLPGRRPVGIRAVRPAPTPKQQAGGRALVYDGPVELVLEPIPTPARRVQVRWAICRADRCVPGTTPVLLPPGPVPGG